MALEGTSNAASVSDTPVNQPSSMVTSTIPASPSSAFALRYRPIGTKRGVTSVEPSSYTTCCRGSSKVVGNPAISASTGGISPTGTSW